MQSNGFWEFLVSVESEYSKYRKRIMNRFSLSSAEVDVRIIPRLTQPPTFREYAISPSRRCRFRCARFAMTGLLSALTQTATEKAFT